MNHADQERLQAALALLGAMTVEIVAEAEGRSCRACPYKTAAHECTFTGKCTSQKRGQNEVRCGGDEFLRRGQR